MKVKSISLWEPWATAMRLGLKTIETRSWPTSYRGPLLICAAKTERGCQTALCNDANVRNIMILAARQRGIEVSEMFNFGKAVALVDLVGCRPTAIATSPVFWDDRPATERFLGDYSPGRFAWMTEPIQTDFEPFPISGSQGFFAVELATEVRNGRDMIIGGIRERS